MMTPVTASRALVTEAMNERNAASREFFARASEPLARLSLSMSERFRRGGRLLAFGSGSATTDAQHVAVEFVHPVLVGKRALPALDLSADYRHSIPAVVREADVVIAFEPADGDPDVRNTLSAADAAGALTLALPGRTAAYACDIASNDPFVRQELCEVAYHSLWETVHVFFEHHALPHDAGPAGFLYPFLGSHEGLSSVIPDVAASIRGKAACDEALRERVAREQGDEIVAAAVAITGRLGRGGTVLCLGNGGSATDATDFALDLCAGPKGYAAVPAISLAADAATTTAIANDVGADAIFLRQVIAQARQDDIVVAVSTSGGSANVIGALVEARRRGLLTIGLLGYDGGEIRRRRLVDHAIVVPSDQIPRVQEVQASMYHVMVDLLHVLRDA